MKGVIIDCFSKMITSKMGEEKWIEILLDAGFTKFTVFPPYSDVPEEYFDRILKTIQKSLGKSENEVADDFGEYWMTVYAPQTYPQFFNEAKCSKDFILMMDFVHRKVTEDIPYSKPPHFEYKFVDENTIQIYYYSSRHLISFLEGLIKGTTKYFNEEIEIEKISENCLQLTFSKK